MKYDFETIINRKGQGSAKWDLMYNTKKDVGDNIIPLSVAITSFCCFSKPLRIWNLITRHR